MRREHEQGATMMLVAASLLLLVGVAAIAIDIGSLRFDIRADQLATDASATAGAASINPFAGSEADQACTVAWDYLLLNLEDEGSSPSAPTCSTFAGTCNPLTARQATGTAGPYSVVFTHPVPDSHPLMTSQAINAVFDGAPCQRLGVELTRSRDFAFAGVLGSWAASTTVHSVARIGAGIGAGEVVPLLVLEPISCDALFTSGQGKITVSYFEDSPGLIVVDSNASKTTNPNRCGNNSWSIDSKGTQNGWIRAIPVPAPDNIPSAILSYALSAVPPANATASYDPGDLTLPATGVDPSDPPESWFRLYPQPVGVSRRITRAPIDWRYNCQTNYPDYPLVPGATNPGDITILPCPNTPAPHIDNLITARATGDMTLQGFYALDRLSLVFSGLVDGLGGQLVGRLPEFRGQRRRGGCRIPGGRCRIRWRCRPPIRSQFDDQLGSFWGYNRRRESRRQSAQRRSIGHHPESHIRPAG